MDGKSEKFEKESLTKQVSKHVKKLGISYTDEPSDAASQMPTDPTRLPPKELQRVFTAMVAWQSYANDNLARVKIALLEAEAALKRAEARYFFTHTDIKEKWKIEAMMLQDKNITALQDRQRVLEAKKIALTTIFENYANKAAALSREQTRRGIEFKRSERL